MAAPAAIVEAEGEFVIPVARVRAIVDAERRGALILYRGIDTERAFLRGEAGDPHAWAHEMNRRQFEIDRAIVAARAVAAACR